MDDFEGVLLNVLSFVDGDAIRLDTCVGHTHTKGASGGGTRLVVEASGRGWWITAKRVVSHVRERWQDRTRCE